MKLVETLMDVGTPLDAQLKATRFENFVVRGLLPFLAGQLYLAALLHLYDTYPDMAYTCAAIAAAGGVALLAASITAARADGILTAVGAASVLAALLFVLPSWSAAIAIAVVTVAYALGMAADRITGGGATLFFLQAAVVSTVARHIPATLRVSVTLVALIASALILILRRRPGAAGAALSGGLLVTVVETGFERAPLYLVPFAAVLAVGALVYEGRRAGRAQSPLRRSVAQLLAVLILLVLAGLVTGWDWRWASLVWFGLVLIVQVIQTVRERARDGVRAVWPAIALIVVVWQVDWSTDWRMRSVLTCAVIGALQAFASWRRVRFATVVAAALSLVPAGVAFDQAEFGAFDPWTLVVQTLVTLTLLAHGVRQVSWRREYRWWRGFVRASYWRTLRHFSVRGMKTVENAAFIGPIYKMIRLAFGWLRYLNGGAQVGLHDFMYVIAHLFGAWMVGGQATALTSSWGMSWPAAALAGQLAWIAWALGLLLFGELCNDVLSRYIGLVLACVPVATDVSWNAGVTDFFDLWLLVATGATLTAYAATRRRQGLPAPGS